MRRNTASSLQHSWLVVFLLCHAVFLLYLLSLFRQDESPAKRPDKASESPSPQQWSAGSAFFTVTATCFGFYAQPRGSLLFSKSGRVWRLSPLYALEDTIAIFWVGIYALGEYHQLYRRWPSLRAIAVSILVMRNANDRDALKDTASVKRYEAPRARRNITVSLTNQDDISIPQLFEEVSHFERGPSFRVFVWGPMLLQLLKLLVVRGSLLPRSLGFVFFISWLINDVLLIVVSLDPLSSMERSQAAFIVDDCNPQALQLITGSYLKVFCHAALYAQSSLSICLIAAFTTGGWENMIARQDTNSTVFSQWGQLWAVLSLSVGCYCVILMTMDCICQIYKNGGVDGDRRLLFEGTATYTAFIDWILRLLCFLAIPPLERFHDAEKTQQPSWYEWLG